MKALIWKELRENLRWLPLGLVLMGILCWWCWKSQELEMPRGIASALVGHIAFASGGFAILLGTMQSAFDLRDSARAYLLQRGVTPAQTFWAKFVAGLVIYATAVGLPLIGMALWLGSVGLHRFPVRPAETIPAALSALAAFSLHPAMIFTLARSARWWGTRLLPLLGSIVCAAFVFPAFNAVDLHGLVVALLLVGWTTWVACQAWMNPTVESHEAAPYGARKWLVNAHLIGSAIAVVCLVANVVQEFVGDFPIAQQGLSRSVARYVDAETGVPWVVQNRSNRPTSTEDTSIIGTPLNKMRGAESLVALPRDLELVRPVRLHNIHSYGLGFNYFEDAPQYGIVYDRRGYLLVYHESHSKRNQRLEYVVASDGVFGASSGLQGEPFTCNPTRMLAYDSTRSIDFVESPGSTIRRELRFLVDGRGIYQLESMASREYQIHAVIETPVDACAYVKRPDDIAPRVLVVQGGTLTEYQLHDSSGSEAWYPKLIDGSESSSDELPPLSGVAIHSVEVPEHFTINGWVMASVAVADRGYTFFKTVLPPSMGEVAIVPIDKSQPKKRFQYEDSSKTTKPRLRVVQCVPPLVRLPLLVWSWFIDPIDGSLLRHWHYEWPFRSEMLLLCISVCMTIYLCISRSASFTTTLVWACAAVPLGLAAPLAIGAICTPPIKEVCAQCGKKRRVDLERCEHCCAVWDVPHGEGIELYDGIAGAI